MVLLIGAACIRMDNGINWLLANPIARYIGMISYGIYLLHMLALNGSKRIRAEHDWIFFVIVTAVSVAMASASYWMFERPFLKLKNRFRKTEQSTLENQVFPEPPAASAGEFDPIRV